jgi:hypothetical protein
MNSLVVKIRRNLWSRWILTKQFLFYILNIYTEINFENAKSPESLVKFVQWGTSQFLCFFKYYYCDEIKGVEIGKEIARLEEMRKVYNILSSKTWTIKLTWVT